MVISEFCEFLFFFDIWTGVGFTFWYLCKEVPAKYEIGKKEVKNGFCSV